MSNGMRSRPEQVSPVDGEGETPAVTTDVAFELLSNRRRRYTLHYLTYADGRVELGELAEHVAAWENNTDIRKIDAAQRKRVYTSLQSHHLPKMDDQGVVSYDDRAGVVELTGGADEFDIYLEVVDGAEIPWSEYYLGLSAVNAALIAAVAIDTWPFEVVPDLAWAGVVVSTVVASAVAHVYHDSWTRLGTAEKPPELRNG